MTSESCFWLVRFILFIVDIQDPWNVTGLNCVMIGRLDGCGDDAERVASDEFVESWEMEIGVNGSQIHC